MFGWAGVAYRLTVYDKTYQVTFDKSIRSEKKHEIAYVVFLPLRPVPTDVNLKK